MAITQGGGGQGITPGSGWTGTTQGGGKPSGLSWQTAASQMYSYAVKVMGQTWADQNLGSLQAFTSNTGHQGTFQAVASGKYPISMWQRDFVADRLYNYAVQTKGQDWATQNYGSLYQFRANKSHWGTFTNIAGGKYSYDQWTKDFNTKQNTTGSPNSPSTDPSKRDAYATLLQTLQQYGLGDLGDWLWKEITTDTPESQIFLDLRNTDAYKKRFPGIVARQKEGLPAISESDYIATEEGYRQQLRRLGVPLDQLTNPGAFLNYFTKDVSPNELSSRVDVWEALNNAPGTTARMRGLFETYAGVKGASNADLYSAIVGADTTHLHTLAGTTFGDQNFTVDQLQKEFKKAVAQEAATFRGGGGQIAEQQGIKSLGGAENVLT